MVAWVRQELKGRLLAARELRDRKARTLLKVGSAALAACKPPNAAAATVAPAACTALRRQKSGGAAVGDVGNSSAVSEHRTVSIANGDYSETTGKCLLSERVFSGLDQHNSHRIGHVSNFLDRIPPTVFPSQEKVHSRHVVGGRCRYRRLVPTHLRVPIRLRYVAGGAHGSAHGPRVRSANCKRLFPNLHSTVRPVESRLLQCVQDHGWQRCTATREAMDACVESAERRKFFVESECRRWRRRHQTCLLQHGADCQVQLSTLLACVRYGQVSSASTSLACAGTRVFC